MPFTLWISEWNVCITVKPSKLAWQPWLKSSTGVPFSAKHCKIPHRSAENCETTRGECWAPGPSWTGVHLSRTGYLLRNHHLPKTVPASCGCVGVEGIRGIYLCRLSNKPPEDSVGGNVEIPKSIGSPLRSHSPSGFLWGMCTRPSDMLWSSGPGMFLTCTSQHQGFDHSSF